MNKPLVSKKMFNLNDCNHNDKLILRNDTVVTYLCKTKVGGCKHRIQFRSGAIVNYTDDGKETPLGRNKKKIEDTPYDIVGFYVPVQSEEQRLAWEEAIKSCEEAGKRP